MVVVLGATAAKALLGPSFRVTQSRGQLMPWPESAQHPQDFPSRGRGRPGSCATIHPSAVLRADDREAAFDGLVDDLNVAAQALPLTPAPAPRPTPPRGLRRSRTFPSIKDLSR